MILNERAQFELAAALRRGTATIGELFTFVSGLYFRGKIAYAAAFADPPHRLPAALFTNLSDWWTTFATPSPTPAWTFFGWLGWNRVHPRPPGFSGHVTLPHLRGEAHERCRGGRT